MLTAQLVSRILDLSGLTAGRVEHASRSLRRAGIVGAAVTADHAAWLLIGIAVPGAALSAGLVVGMWAGMRSPEGCGYPTFGAALAAILADTAGDLNVIEVRICTDFPAARIVTGFRHGGAVYDFADHESDYQAKPIRRALVLSGGVLRTLANAVAGLDQESTLPGYQTAPCGGCRAANRTSSRAGVDLRHNEQGADATANPFSRHPAAIKEIRP